MTTSEDLGKILASTPQSFDRILVFGALLARESGSDLVIVGGSAIEVYTRGGYVSGDLDIRADRGAVDRALAGWNFKHEGRLWIHSEWKFAVDVVGDQYSGDPYRAMTIVTPFGPVRIAVVEDLFVKRLAAAKHWQVRAAIDEADLLWRDYRETMDPIYLDRQALTYKVADLLAEFRRKSPSSDTHAEEARTGNAPG
jgi:hypothetical protein